MARPPHRTTRPPTEVALYSSYVGVRARCRFVDLARLPLTGPGLGLRAEGWRGCRDRSRKRPLLVSVPMLCKSATAVKTRSAN